jgi:hypothetical protein
VKCRNERGGRRAQWIRIAVMLVLAAGVAWFCLKVWRQGFRTGYVLAVVFQVCALLLTLWFFLLRFKIGPAEVSLTPTEVPVGGAVCVTWRQPFNRRARVRKAAIKLVFAELAGTGGGKGSRTYGEETVVQQVEQVDREYEAGEELVLSGRLRVPLTGMHSFKAEDNELSWDVQVMLKIEGWKDDLMVYRRVLRVQPRIGR